MTRPATTRGGARALGRSEGLRWWPLLAVLFLVSCDGFTTVRGTVRDALGAPVARATVRLLEADGRLLREATTAADGTFRIGTTNGWFPDTFALHVTKPGYVTFSCPVKPNSRSEVQVTLAEERDHAAGQPARH